MCDAIVALGLADKGSAGGGCAVSDERMSEKEAACSAILTGAWRR